MVGEKDQLKALMDALPEGIISMDIQGNIVHVNKGAASLLGYNSYNLSGKSIFDLAPSYAVSEIKDLFNELQILKTIKDKKIQLYDVRGQLRDLKMSFSLLKDDKAKPIGVVSTIDDLKAAANLKKELEDERDLPAGIINGAGVGILATNLKGDIIFASSGTKEVFNKEPEELIGKNLINISKDPLLLNERFQRLTETGKSFEYELGANEKEGIRNFLNVFTLLRDRKKRPKGAIVVFKDISRIKEIEGQLKDSNAILKERAKDLKGLVEITRNLGSSLDKEKIYESMAEAVKQILDAPVMCFFRYSEKGFALDFIEGSNKVSTQELNCELEESRFYSILRELKGPKIFPDLKKEKSFQLPEKLSKRDLKSAVLVPIFRKEGIFGVLAVFLNSYREYKKEEIEILQSIGASAAVAVENAKLYAKIKSFAAELEEKVRERTTDLEKSNKLKDLFIDIMGHDLLKPVDISRLSLELILDQEEAPDKKKILENILLSQKRMIDLIENARVLAKLESGKKLEFEEGDLGDALRGASDELAGAASAKNIKIRVNAEGEFPAMINPLIYDVFSNLLGNAVKYGPSDADIIASISSEGSNWRITVADNGEGIADKYKKEIFDRFKRLEKGGVKGTGLGLAIVKRVVAAHNGKAWVEDNPGGGSLFCVDIPKSTGD
jgi:PAS domain S-box-containing protein